MKRRSAVVALGSLLFESGALSANAAFNNSVNSTGDLRVVSAEILQVEAGDAFNDDGTVRNSEPYIPNTNGEDYVEFTSGKGDFFGGVNDAGLEDIDASDLPVATVNNRNNNVNSDVIVRTAVDLEHDTYTFKNILRLENNGTSTVQDIGIKYEGGYGEDVNDSNNNVSKQLAQYMYRFKAEDRSGKPQISPDGGNGSEDPKGTVDLNPNETLNLTLDLEFSTFTTFGVTVDPKKRIRNAADTSGNPFNYQSDTVQILKTIEVGEGW